MFPSQQRRLAVKEAGMNAASMSKLFPFPGGPAVRVCVGARPRFPHRPGAEAEAPVSSRSAS